PRRRGRRGGRRNRRDESVHAAQTGDMPDGESAQPADAVSASGTSEDESSPVWSDAMAAMTPPAESTHSEASPQWASAPQQPADEASNPSRAAEEQVAPAADTPAEKPAPAEPPRRGSTVREPVRLSIASEQATAEPVACADAGNTAETPTE